MCKKTTKRYSLRRTIPTKSSIFLRLWKNFWHYPVNHPARTIKSILDRIDLYEAGGASKYHPGMLLKDFIYGYMEIVFLPVSCKRRSVRTSLLCGRRGCSVPTTIPPIGSGLKGWRHDLGYFFTGSPAIAPRRPSWDQRSVHRRIKDGSQWNRYTFVWTKAIMISKKRISQQLKELWEFADSVAREEQGNPKQDVTNYEIRMTRLKSC